MSHQWDQQYGYPQSPVRKRHTGLIVSVCVLGGIVFLIGASVLLGYLLRNVQPALPADPATPHPDSTVVSATLVLNDQETADNGCEGVGGYSDISTGASVVLLDQAGEIVGSTTLDEGEADTDAGTCEWQMEFDDVPTNRTQYKFQLGDRGGLTYSHSHMVEADWFVGAEIG